jgi:hypothetical protein
VVNFRLVARSIKHKAIGIICVLILIGSRRHVNALLKYNHRSSAPVRMQASALKSANKIIRNVIKGELLRGPKQTRTGCRWCASSSSSIRHMTQIPNRITSASYFSSESV